MPKRTLPTYSTSALMHPKYWPTWILVGLWWLLSQLPHPWLIRVGKFIGPFILVHCNPTTRKIIQANLKLGFPKLSENDRRTLMINHAKSFGVSFLEMGISQWCSYKKIRPIVKRLKGLDIIHKSYKRGRGVILITPHMTMLDVVGHVIAKELGIPVHAFYRQQKNPVLERTIAKGRLRYSKSLIKQSENLKMAKLLKAGEAIFYLPDHDYGPKRSVFAPFMGVPTATTFATSRMASINQSAVVFIGGGYDKDEKGYVVEIHEPFSAFPSGDDVADAVRINQAFETVVKNNPEHYMWFFRRFRTRPPGEPRVYEKKREKK